MFSLSASLQVHQCLLRINLVRAQLIFAGINPSRLFKLIKSEPSFVGRLTASAKYEIYVETDV